ncbi:hypothetical protein L873DRAFT_1088253 [Choiromyces venosus 120613-1]|uniref:Uncharacterized protein n=1 Tax=Choiromyces venosus 120613-1 TaxID=1336337 RepID=A0A3N4JHP2_9PEZI|nr:hypothetical protein L873DRAFT_1088253 [Choiromyces venosus 120613-1]
MIYFEHCIHFTIIAVSGTRYKLFQVVLSTFQSCLCLLKLFAQMSFLLLQLRAYFLMFR